MGPQDPKNVTRDTARDLAGLAGELAALMAVGQRPVRDVALNEASGSPGHPPARPRFRGRPGAANRGRVPRRLRPGCALGYGARCRLRCGVRPRRLGLQDRAR
jgi:hypothetical protein